MWVRPDWVHPSFSAARVKLPSSAAVTSASHFFVSICRLLPLQILFLLYPPPEKKQAAAGDE